MTDLCHEYSTFLEREGVQEPNCRSYVLKARLVAHFGDRLCFHRPQKRNQSEFVFRAVAPRGPLIERCATALADCDAANAEHLHVADMCSYDDESHFAQLGVHGVYHAALFI